MFKRFLMCAAALAVLYGAAWTGAAFWFKARLEAVAADLRREGYTVETSDLLLVGFPARVGVMTARLDVTAPPAHGGWRWEAGPTRVSLAAGAPRTAVVDLTGRHRIAGLLSAPDVGLALTVGRGAAHLVFARDRSLDAVELTLADMAVGDGAGALRLGDAALHADARGRSARASAHGIALPEAVPVLGGAIATLGLTFDITGDLPSGPLPAALEAWRAGGGALELRAFALDWGPARAAGSGTFALDAALQPIGALTVKFQGFFDIVDALVKEGHVPERNASMAKIVLGILAKPPAAGGAPELSLPLTVQDRKLFAGPVMLMETPEVRWNAHARIPD